MTPILFFKYCVAGFLALGIGFLWIVFIGFIVLFLITWAQEKFS